MPAGRPVIEGRRDEVVQAAWQVIAREGLARATVRRIAQEIGTTTGVVTHHFRDKKQLLLFVFHEVAAAADRRIQRDCEGKGGLAWIEALMLATLPKDDEFAERWHVWISFLAGLNWSADVRKAQETRYENLVSEVAKRFRQAIRAGEVDGSIHAQTEAKAVIALTTGIAIGQYITPNSYDPKVQHKIIKSHIAKLRCDLTSK